MRNTARTVTIAICAVFAAACASQGKDVDSESHFQCTTNRDCRDAEGRTACVEGYCAIPRTDPRMFVEGPGAAADCTASWPAEARSFETLDLALPPVSYPTNYTPPMNRNGTVIVGLSGSERASDGKQHLLRWTPEGVSRIEQTGEHILVPTAVSCDGLTVVGKTENGHQQGYRWSARDGFSELERPGAASPYESLTVGAVTDDGATALGVYVGDSSSAAVRWRDGVAEPLFDIGGADAEPGWSADGSTFVGAGVWIFKATQTEPLSFLMDLPARATAVSFDGSFIASFGLDTTDSASTEDSHFLWSPEHGTEPLPDAIHIDGVSVAGVAVGMMRSPTPRSGEMGFVWDRKHGARFLRDILAAEGVELPGETVISRCQRISADARVITGIASDSRGVWVFRAVLPTGAFD